MCELCAGWSSRRPLQMQDVPNMHAARQQRDLRTSQMPTVESVVCLPSSSRSPTWQSENVYVRSFLDGCLFSSLATKHLLSPDIRSVRIDKCGSKQYNSPTHCRRYRRCIQTTSIRAFTVCLQYELWNVQAGDYAQTYGLFIWCNLFGYTLFGNTAIEYCLDYFKLRYVFEHVSTLFRFVHVCVWENTLIIWMLLVQWTYNLWHFIRSGYSSIRRRRHWRHGRIGTSNKLWLGGSKPFYDMCKC